MTKRVFSLIAVAALGALSCKSQHEKVIPEDPAVVIRPDHSHSRYCGHYCLDGQWYYAPDHRHGIGCGHELVEGLWRLKT